ncbi:ABC transporter permease [Maledivibacter halophilus]|uniref:MacB-like core domain-containing protein n=1 Tax=Maledivibacter halophilus TaxID=36842 RepID=A0A1T5ILP4_9FIRM|nr:ABC transporter permease [Maledivibacter halophilus]SKC40065.1 MacB-like core domain-containing protein [Maledivibacter halophilus]
MHNVKIWNILQACGILILILCIFFIEGINENTMELLGTVGSKRISIEAKENIINNEKLGFNEKEIYELKNSLTNNICSFTFPFEANIKTSSNSMLIKALAVNSAYKNFTDINIVNGSFFTEEDEKNKKRNLIIEENTALELFKSTDIVGMNVQLMKEDFKIIGIYKNKASFLNRLIRKKEPNVYIPLQTIFSLNKDIRIPCFQISISNEDGEIKSEKSVINLLENMGKSSANYKIIDYRNFQRQGFQMNHLITFIFGILIIFYIIKIQVKIVKRISLTIRENYKLQYFLKAIESSRKILIYLILKFLFLAFCLYLIVQVIKFDLYIAYTGNNLIKSYLSFILNAFFEIGNSKSLLDSIVYFSILLISFISILGIPLGGFLLLSSFYFLKYIHSPIERILLFFSTTYASSLIAASVIIKISKLPLVMNIESIIIIYIFIFLKTYSLSMNHNQLNKDVSQFTYKS